MNKPASAHVAASGLEQPPPILQRWSRIYWLVAGLLAAEVAVFWLLSRWAS